MKVPHNRQEAIPYETLDSFLRSLTLCSGKYSVGKHLLKFTLRDDLLLLVCELPTAYLEKREALEDELCSLLKKTFSLTPSICFTADTKPANSLLPQIKRTLVVSSGKGGVGKSSVALSLALSLQKQGYRVGLLDADLYGPSLPILLNLLSPTLPLTEDKKMIPLEVHGIHCMSIGFLVPLEAPLIWRGPMLQGALLQLLRDVEWPSLDFLIVDTPPGTGDVHLTLMQKIPTAEALIVSMPQKISLVDARKAVLMYKKLNIPILGLVQNMTDAYSQNLSENELGIPTLLSLPFEPTFRNSCDLGEPFVLHYPSHPLSLAFHKLAKHLS